MIIKTAKEEYNILQNISLIVPQQMDDKYSKIFKPEEKTLKKIINNLKKPFSINDIKRRSSNVRSMTLEVTQNCNLRCRYCGYGGNYFYNRTHNNRSMRETTIKKAFDFFFDMVNSPYRSSREDLVFSFYGGEPLLNFDDIINACDYAEELNRKREIQQKIRFMITTNGVLFSRDRIQKLLSRNFMIDISLDGPKDQHDMMRIKTDNSGTFEDLFSNLLQLKKEFPSKYNNIRFLLTIHPLHDITKIEQFFLSNNNLFHEYNVIISMVNFKHLLGNIKKDWIEARRDQVKQITENLDKSSWFYKKIIASWLDRIYSSPTQVLALQEKFTGACFPAINRLFIDVDGLIHICEKINSYFSIGNVYTGLDYEAISNIINKWNGEILRRRCWECEMWWVCNFCFATQATNDSMKIGEDECRKLLKSTHNAFGEFLTLMEAKDEANTFDNYSHIDRYLELLQ